MNALEVKHRIAVLYGAFGALVLAAGFMAGYFQHGLRIKTETRQVQVAPKTLAALVKAWGKPDQQIDGSQINQGLQGSTCYLYQSRKVLLCG